MSTISLKCEIPNKFNQFRNQPYFQDIVLEHHNQVFRTNRLVLACQSTWFHDYFAANPKATEIKFEENFGEHFEDVLDFFYSGSVTINPINFAEHACLAYYFRITALQALLAQHLSVIISEMNVLNLFRSLNEAKIYSLSRILLPLIAKTYYNHINFTRNDLIESLSIPLIVPLLDEPQLLHLSIFERIEFVNDFISQKNLELTEADKKHFENVINWAHPDALTAFSRFSCDWLPIKIQKKLLSKLLDQRTSLLTEFSAVIEDPPDVVGHWFPFSWLSHISAGRKEKAGLHMISTLGDSTKNCDPVKYRLISLVQAAPLVPLYNANNLFSSNSKHYYMSRLMDAVTPGFEVDLGPKTRCEISLVRVISEVKGANGKLLLSPKNLNIFGKDDEGNEVFSSIISLNNHKYVGNIENSVPFQTLGIQMTSLGQNSSSILRISKFDFECDFLP